MLKVHARSVTMKLNFLCDLTEKWFWGSIYSTNNLYAGKKEEKSTTSFRNLSLFFSDFLFIDNSIV